jgi:hypothetical protein
MKLGRKADQRGIDWELFEIGSRGWPLHGYWVLHLGPDMKGPHESRVWTRQHVARNIMLR